MTKCGKEAVGKKLEGSGSKRWKNIEEAKKHAEAAGHILGQTCHYIENKGGRVHWYAAEFDSNDWSGTETWSFWTLEDLTPEYAEDAPYIQRIDY